MKRKLAKTNYRAFNRFCRSPCDHSRTEFGVGDFGARSRKHGGDAPEWRCSPDRRIINKTMPLSSSISLAVPSFASAPTIAVIICDGSDVAAPAFNGEQHLCQQRHMEDQSRYGRLEPRRELDCPQPSLTGRTDTAYIRRFQYNWRLHLGQHGSERHRVQRGRKRVHDHRRSHIDVDRQRRGDHE